MVHDTTLANQEVDRAALVVTWLSQKQVTQLQAHPKITMNGLNHHHMCLLVGYHFLEQHDETLSGLPKLPRSLFFFHFSISYQHFAIFLFPGVLGRKHVFLYTNVSYQLSYNLKCILLLVANVVWTIAIKKKI